MFLVVEHRPEDDDRTHLVPKMCAHTYEDALAAKAACERAQRLEAALEYLRLEAIYAWLAQHPRPAFTPEPTFQSDVFDPWVRLRDAFLQQLTVTDPGEDLIQSMPVRSLVDILAVPVYTP